MPGLVPGIHGLNKRVDGRDKLGFLRLHGLPSPKD
jgi:hypothetical protein